VLTHCEIISHGIFLNDHPWSAWPGAEDFDTLKNSGAAVAHCPTVFRRRGVTMNIFGRYLRNSIPMGIGTDTYLNNILEEIRHALITSRIISKNPYDLRTTTAFDAATTGGAVKLGMDNIGKLSPGMKSGLFMADITHREMRLLRDPLASLIYVSGERAVTETFVDGKALMRDGALTTFDLDDALDGLEAAQARAAKIFQTLDFRNRTHDEAAPINHLRGTS